MLITAMGAAFFVGLRSAAPDMRYTFNNYYMRQSMFDIQVISNYGLTDSYIDRLRAVEGVEYAVPARSTDLFASFGDRTFLFRLHSGSPSDLEGVWPGVPEILAGRMPENTGEIAVSARFAETTRRSVGDVLTLSTGDDTSLEAFVAQEMYVIVGVVDSPLYVRGDLGSSNKGSGSLQAYAYIPFDDFIGDVYTEAQIIISNPDGLSRFDEAFGDVSALIEDELQLVGDEIAAHRRRILMSRASREISSATASLETARESLARNERELTESELAFAESEQALIRQRTALNELISAGRLDLDSGNAEIAAARLSIDQGKLALADARIQLEMMRATIEPGDSNMELQLGIAEAELAAKEGELQNAEAELDEKRSQILYAYAALDAVLYGGLAKLTAAESELSAARDALEDGRLLFTVEKSAAEAMMAASESTVSKARRALLDMPDAKCYVLGLDRNVGFESFRQDCDRIESISRVIPMFFFLVAALVAFTCMVRIVEDDRSTAAVMQSLGYSSAIVSAKYILYALSVCIPGTILGIAVGHQLFPTIIFDFGYRIMYVVPPAEILLYPDLCVSVSIISLISVVIPTILVGAGDRELSPAALMRPKAPPPGKRIMLERVNFIWTRMQFSSKVTARNILRYKKRFFMTIAGISGCTAIVLTGFGLRDSIRAVADNQFGDLFLYDFIITAADGRADRMDLERQLRALSEVTDWQYQRHESVDVGLDARGTLYETTLLVPDDAGLLADFVKLADPQSRAPVSPTDNGVVITEKLASLLGIAAGDRIIIIDEDDAEWALTVEGVAENYIGHYVYMTPRHYIELTGTVPKMTTIVGKSPRLENTRRDEISELLLENRGVVSLSFNSRMRNFYDETLDALNVVIFVLIVCGALLAFVVLFSLTGINIDERKREIATLKVLGFFEKEASSYIFRENIVNTVAGSILGLGFGVILHKYVMQTVEMDMMMFGKTVAPMSHLYAAILTVLFTLMVNAAMSGDIRDIDMIESLKSVE